MFSKKERLSKGKFDRFFRIGKRYHSDNFTLIYLPFGSIKSAVVVGKKVFKKAVDRNLLRRRVYSVLREVLTKQVGTGVYLILTKPTAAALDFASIKAEIEGLVKSIGIKS